MEKEQRNTGDPTAGGGGKGSDVDNHTPFWFVAGGFVLFVVLLFLIFV